ncbi:MAG TPA: DUF2007 domain-containing protein [Thermoanaerobaculia bacterium]|nr:DUF2007 domain-containing protein [Thermoanaerobaculia bacterium]
MPDESANTITAEDGTTLVEIASVGTEDEARLLQGFLEAEGVPAQIEDVKFHMEPINFGAMGEIRIFVTADDEPRAQQLLREREREYEQLDDEDETLVTDDGVAEIEDGAQAESDDGATS